MQTPNTPPCLPPATKSPVVSSAASACASQGAGTLRPSHRYPFACQFTDPNGWWSHGLTGSDRLSFRVQGNYRA